LLLLRGLRVLCGLRLDDGHDGVEELVGPAQDVRVGHLLGIEPGSRHRLGHEHGPQRRFEQRLRVEAFEPDDRGSGELGRAGVGALPQRSAGGSSDFGWRRLSLTTWESASSSGPKRTKLPCMTMSLTPEARARMRSLATSASTVTDSG